MLTIKNLTVKAKEKTILDNISFTFEREKIYALMGPNGSGKSTFAYAIVGHPEYQLEKGEIIMEKRDISHLTPDKRAKLGIFLSFQSPLSLSGINVFQLLTLALSGREDPLTVKRKIDQYAKELRIPSDLINRSLNEWASGGERKKLEILQAAIISPKFLIFDEIDTGIDVDALKIIGRFINNHKKNKTYLLITHYNRILKHVKPDCVMVMINGKIAKLGNYKLAYQIEKEGYEKLYLQK